MSSAYRPASQIFLTRVRSRKSRSRWSLPLCLIFFAVVQLNFQRVLYDLMGVPIDSGSSNPVLLIWAFMLLFVLTLSVGRLFRLVRIQRVEAWAALFLLVCAAHGLIIGTTAGPAPGMFSFLAWGLGVGVLLQVGRDGTCDGPRFVMLILVLSGVVNAVPVVWESLTGNTIYKFVTHANQTRLYGISQSVSILGLQLAVGVIASAYLLLATKRRLLMSFILILQVWALIASTSRGPLLYMMFVLMMIAVLMPSSIERRMICACLFGTVISFALFLSLLFPIQIENGSQLSFLVQALSLEDQGNSERVMYFEDAFDLLFSSFSELMLGRGAGTLSIVSVRFGGTEFGSESSILKIFLELGVIGAVPFFAVALGLLGTGLRNWIKRGDMGSLFLLGCFLIVLMQATTHELLKAWIGSVYFWLIAGGLLHTRLVNRNSHRLDRAEP